MTIYHETIRAYCAAISDLNADGFAACFTADCELNDPVGAPPAMGQAGAKAFFNGLAPLLSKMQIRAGHIHIGGTKAAFTWAIEAEGKNGQFVTADGIDMMEFDAAGKITRSFGFWNPGPFVAALTA